MHRVDFGSSWRVGGAGACGVRGSDLASERNLSHTRRKETTQKSGRLELEHLTIQVSRFLFGHDLPSKDLNEKAVAFKANEKFS